MEVAAVLEYIEANLEADLTLDGLARRARMSAYHFHRRFHEEVGEPPMRYVRRLRLEAAAVRLKLSQRSVTNVALDAGYATHEGFTRAFHTRFGTAPQSFRAAHGAAALPPGFAPRIVSLPPRRIAFLRYVGPYDASAAAFAWLAAWAAARGALGDAMLGLYYDDQDITAPERTRCDVALIVEAHTEGDGEVKLRDLRGGDYAVIPQAGLTSERRHFYEVAFRTWLPSIRRRPSRAPCFERYALRDGTADQSASEIHIPLHRR